MFLPTVGLYAEAILRVSRLQPISTLFPYTTLFRSSPKNWTRPIAPGVCAQLFGANARSEEHTSELQSRGHRVCRLLLEKKDERAIGKGTPGPRRDAATGERRRRIATGADQRESPRGLGRSAAGRAARAIAHLGTIRSQCSNAGRKRRTRGLCDQIAR